MRTILFLVLLFVDQSFAINIDQKWRDSTSGIISVPGEYKLIEDIKSEKYGFIIDASNVNLDLNNKTVTYGYGDSIIVFNQGFEYGTDIPDGWNFLNAPFAKRKMGHYSMLKEWEDPPSCYNGEYAIAVTVPSPLQSIISEHLYTFQAGISYNVSAMAYNHYNNKGDSIRFFIKITDVDGNTLYKASKGYGIYWRGFIPIYLEFVPSNTFNGRIGFEVESMPNEPVGEVYVDDVRIQTSHYHGILVGCDTTAREQLYMSGDISNRYFNQNYRHSKKKISNVVIKNGKVKSGNTRPFRSFAIYLEGNSLYDTVYNVDTEVNGIASYNFGVKTVHGWRISNSEMINNSPCGLTRDVMSVAYIKADYSTVGYPYGALIDSNYAYGSCHAGFIVRGSCDLIDDGIDKYPLIHIYRNYINHSAKYSNGFGIFSYGGAGVFAEENLIIGNGRGIQFAALTKDCVQNPKILNNFIDLSGLGLNQEYVVVLSGEAMGIQLDGSDSVSVIGNIVNVNSYNTWYNKTGKSYVDAIALRVSEAGDGLNTRILVKDNVFNAIAHGKDGAQAINFYDINGNDILFDGNEINTNDVWVTPISGTDSVLFINNTFGLIDGLKPNDSAFSPFRKNDLYSASTNLLFINNKFQDALTKDKFINSYFKNSSNSYLNYASKKTSWFFGWNKIVHISKPSDSTLTIINSIGDTIYSTLDSVFNLVFCEFRDSAQANIYDVNRDRTYYNPYRFTVNGLIDTVIYINDDESIYLKVKNNSRYIIQKR